MLIFADDFGWKDVHYQGSDFMDTLNIDRLAKGGWCLPRVMPPQATVPHGRELDLRTGFRTLTASVIYKGNWKFHLYHEEWQFDGGRDKLSTNHAVELYNLAEDIDERNNLADTNPTKRDELLDDLLAWLKTTNASVPTKPNPVYDPSAVADKDKAAGNRKHETEADE